MRVRPLILAVLASVACWGTSHAALYVTPNGLAVYDSTQNITWLRDANLAATNTFGAPGIQPGGIMLDWPTAQGWVTAMNAANYLGVSTWRLPATVEPDPTCSDFQNIGGFPPQGFGGGCTASELPHLAEVDGITSSTSTPGPFFNIQNNLYWSATAFAPDLTGAAHWHYLYSVGCGHAQGQGSTVGNPVSAWPVAPGNPLNATLDHPFVPTIVVAQIGIGWYPAPPLSYDVVEGDLGVLRGAAGDYQSATDACLASHFVPSSCHGSGCTNGNCLSFTASPVAGGGYWFLVRPVGGSYNLWDPNTAAPRDAGINSAPAACP